MHIPDGYLSPSTCAVMYAGAAPFWAVALKRLQRSLQARLIQAIFFGDGGITCYGANCFNMAIVGSLAAYLVYRAVSGKSAITSPRRIAGCALGGYVGINLSALCAAIEFGVQPALFHDAAGAPLYAPYPLSISIPAMLAAHLSLAGVAELVIGGALVAYLQRADPRLLKRTAPGAAADEPIPDEAAGWDKLRPLWIGLAVLMLVTPLGLLATASAWGEWGVAALKNPVVRQQIAISSGNVQPPVAIPSGLERLSAVWTAPIPDYAPKFLKSEKLGYICSAMFGTGLVLAAWLVLGWIVRHLHFLEK